MPNIDYAVTAQDFEIVIDTPGQEFSLELPEQIKALELQCREMADIKHSFTQGTVTATGYRTLKSGAVYRKAHLYLNKHTLYIAADLPATVEVRIWT